MKLVVGLGNPGEKYQNNRHNIGHIFIEYLRSKIEDLSQDQRSEIKILATDCFMNESGKFVAKRVEEYGGDRGDWGQNLFIIHDDLDVPLGKYKIDFGVGPRVHYGINSIEAVLGTKDFWRVRIGVDNREQENRTAGEEYVLQDFLPGETGVLDNLFPEIYEELRKHLNKN